MNKLALDLSKLTAEEKLELIDALWRSISPDELPLDPELGVARLPMSSCCPTYTTPISHAKLLDDAIAPKYGWPFDVRSRGSSWLLTPCRGGS
jgi:hypothetical protein